MSPARMGALELFRLLRGDNCRECGLPTCLAFAAQVSLGERRLDECPHLIPGTSVPDNCVADDPETHTEQRPDDVLGDLKARVRQLDFEEAAARLEAPLSDGRISVRCLGKVFEVDRRGELHSDCHVHAWVHVPVLNHLLIGRSRKPTGDWVRYAELRGARDWERFFDRRCEQGFTRLLIEDPELLFDILELFSSQEPLLEEDPPSSRPDFRACLVPIPGVRLMFNCWLPDTEFEAKLTMLFDRSSETSLDAGSIFMITRGVLEMVTRFAERLSP